MREIYQGYFTGERTLFQAEDMKIYDSIFDDGESPLKHRSATELSLVIL